ncbi:MAG: 2,5-diamino-6-(ribosylamino)-4(3H)-pyrimidinone 5'-phosphate reductase [Halobellus sp.]|uniref:2,5-diamino-6-(ribosylamino)-4(3H)-pyrimidinone 5'-phosphate reductase n=1 Tax=Halobellus sp. TaxID=1979212 RepID=UPI0035D47EBB
MHVVVNAAMSADGKLSSRRREQVRISGSADFTRVDRLRADNDAILVGVGTVLADDPHLTLDDEELRDRRRERDDDPNPARVVVDSTGRTPLDARILDDAAETYLLTSQSISDERRRDLEAAGATALAAGTGRVDLESALSELEADGIRALMIEGGGEIIYSLFAAGLVDELSVYVGSLVIGGRDAPTLVDGDGFEERFPSLSLRATTRIGDGVLLEYDVDGR